MGKRNSILGGIPNGGMLIDAKPAQEFEILTFDDGEFTVYSAKAWVGGRDGGLMTDGAQCPYEFTSAALLRMFLTAIGWSERGAIASIAMGVG